MNVLQFPADLLAAIRLPGGRTATLRPVVPEDAVAEREFVAGLSQRSRFYRFHGAVNGLTDAMTRYLTCVDQSQHVAVVATVVEDGHETVVADARYVVSDDTAEFAIAVSDRFQHCGIARRLMKVLFFCAKRSGLRWLVGEVLATNKAMLALAAKFRFVQARARDQGVVRVECAVDTVWEEEPGVVGRAIERVRTWMSPRKAEASRDMFVPF